MVNAVIRVPGSSREVKSPRRRHRDLHRRSPAHRDYAGNPTAAFGTAAITHLAEYQQ
jgi:hypothetical protein